MSTARDVAVFVGSLRRESFSKKLALTLAELAPPELSFEIVEIGQLELYNQDLEVDPPASWVRLRQRIVAASAVLFVTPEYNRSVPAVLKNAIDVGSRPKERNAWNGKPGAVISVSPGNLAAFGAHHHLRQSLVALNIPVMQQPEAYIGGVAKMFNESGTLTNDGTREFLRKFVVAFAGWIERLAEPKD